jgi:hypothetical protein
VAEEVRFHEDFRHHPGHIGRHAGRPEHPIGQGNQVPGRPNLDGLSYRGGHPALLKARS